MEIFRKLNNPVQIPWRFRRNSLEIPSKFPGNSLEIPSEFFKITLNLGRNNRIKKSFFNFITNLFTAMLQSLCLEIIVVLLLFVLTVGRQASISKNRKFRFGESFGIKPFCMALFFKCELGPISFCTTLISFFVVQFFSCAVFSF